MLNRMNEYRTCVRIKHRYRKKLTVKKTKPAKPSQVFLFKLTARMFTKLENPEGIHFDRRKNKM